MALSVSFLFSAMNLQTASKNELMCIKGIGDKKANAIIKYRKANKIKVADDLLNIKGFGKKLVEKVKKGEKTLKCGGKKSVTKKVKAKKDTAKSKKSVTKSTPSKIEKTKESLKKETPKEDKISQKDSKSVEKKNTPKKEKSIDTKVEDKK